MFPKEPDHRSDHVPDQQGDGWDRPILCDEKVFQYGDAIAMVCADTEAHAREAAKHVKVDLEVLRLYVRAGSHGSGRDRDPSRHAEYLL
ncbi:MAG: hypothetical protein ACLUOI_14900 [Eisenbergiella sp.]